MALASLKTEEMIEISGGLVEQGGAPRSAIEKIPLLNPVLPELQKVHDAIFAIRGKEQPQLRALSGREAEVDAKHDNYVRGIYSTLTTLAPLSNASTELLELRDKLFPEGLLHTRKSYRGEAGHAAMVASQVDAAMETKMKAVQLHQKTLFDLYNEWQAAAKELGDLEEERARLSESAPSVAGEIQGARNAWIRVMKLFVANAEMAKLDVDTDNLLFSALRAAEKAAESRGRTKAAPSPAPAPNSTTTTPSSAGATPSTTPKEGEPASTTEAKKGT